MEIRKYELTDESITFNGSVLYRIRAVSSFGDVREGDLGGYIESEDNLSHFGSCWVFMGLVYGRSRVEEHAKVRGKGIVCDNACVSGYATVNGWGSVEGNAKVRGRAVVTGHAEVRGDILVDGDAVIGDLAVVDGVAEIVGDAVVEDSNDFLSIKVTWSAKEYITYTRSNGLFSCGRFHGTGDDLIRMYYGYSDEAGRSCEKFVNFVRDLEDIRRDYL